MTNKRKIFEDQASDSRAEQTITATSIIDQGRSNARRSLQIWLTGLFLLVAAMILVGGLTRLNDAGLAITQWAPIVGAIPPLNAAEWQAEFARYQQIDEWRIQNQWMSLADFKAIYWWEWGHRQLGRVIGVVWLVGLIWFWTRKQIPTGWMPRLLLLGALGGLQGLIGWWMVASGLTLGTGTLDVAPYRLSIHLGLAFIILGYLWWCISHLGRSESDLLKAYRFRERHQQLGANVLIVLAFLQILLGALMAGLNAGQVYTDWPLIGGEIFPSDAFYLEPVARNIVESPGLVQFMHRTSGYVLGVACLMVWFNSRRSAHSHSRKLFSVVLAAVGLQICSGVFAVIYAAPFSLAILHQFLAIVLWICLLQAKFVVNQPILTSLR